MSKTSKIMGQFDHLFKKSETAASGSKAPTAATEPSPSPAPTETPQSAGPLVNPPLEFKDGKSQYYAISAPKYERREWFFVAPRFQSKMHCPEMLRYDLLVRILYSPAGDNFALVYSDMFYLFKGRGLRNAVVFIADRYLEFLQEFDPTLHRPLESDDPIITSIEAFARRDPTAPDWLKSGSQ